MNRKKLVAANWKMNLTVPEAVSLAKAICDAASKRPEVEVVVCPSYTLLHAVSGSFGKGATSLGAQDVFWEEKGAFTGQVSAAMLLDAGCKHCIVGHSEKRGRFGSGESTMASYFSDTDQSIAAKLEALSYVGIHPILCVGETAAEREAGRTEEVIAKQLNGAFANLSAQEIAGLSIAYEPVWAIGTGKVCDSAEANRVCGFVRKEAGGGDIRVLYGGSVKADNASELFAQPEIDGGLVGGASLHADEFSRIIFAA